MRKFLEENRSINEAYDFITNVCIRQGRFLDSKELYKAYQSMRFKMPLGEEAFNMLIDCMKESLTVEAQNSL